MKKTLSFLLVLAMVLSSFTFAFAADQVKPNAEVKTHTPYIVGKDDGTFAPKDSITKEEVATMLARALDLKAATPKFEDADKIGGWAKDYVGALQEAGIVQGNDKGCFEPKKEVTRAELATMLVNAYEGEIEVGENSFKDVPAKAWYADAVKKAASAGFVKGVGNDKFNPNNPATREQTVVMVNRMLGLEDVVGADKLETELKDVEEWSDWAKDAILVASTQFSYEVVDGEVVIVDEDEEVVDKEALEAKVAEVAELVEEDYTEETWEALQTAVKAAEAVVADEEATQEEVDAALADLVDAIEALEEAEVELEVVDVSAINAKEVEIKFNKALNKESAEDKLNYEVDLNDAGYGNPTDAQLQEDGKTVILRFTALSNGQTYQVKVLDTLLDANYVAIEEYESELALFNDKVAPKVVSVEYNGTDVVVTFDEPVNTTVGSIKIDGYVAGTTLTAVDAGKAGNYEYKIATLPSGVTDAGTHNVVLNDVADDNSNVASTLTGSYTVVKDATAPAVSGIEAVGQNSFKVKFDKAVAGTSADAIKNLKIKKGINTIDNSRVTPSLSNDSKTLTFTIVEADDQLPLYAEGENSVTLSVSFDGYKDANGLLGKAYNGTITLSKDTTAPKVVSDNLVKFTNGVAGTSDAVLIVPYNEEIQVDSAKVADIVVKKDGIVQTAIVPTATLDSTDTDGETLEINFGQVALDEGVYTVEIPKGLVEDIAENDADARTFTFTVSSAVDYFIPTVIDPVDNKNEIKVTSAKEFTDSALALSNYKLDGKALPAGTTINFVDDKMNIVIDLPQTFEVVADASYNLEISSNVVDEDGAAVAANTTTGGTFTKLVTLKDNVAPELKKVEIVKDSGDDTKFNTLTLTFSEDLGALGTTNIEEDFLITVNGSKVAVFSVATSSNPDELTVEIGDGAELFNVDQTVVVETVGETDDNTVIDITDVGGNELVSGTKITATK